ncbi:MAG: hypothetical protein AAFV53_30710 [Myxococcota bacterium]
MERAPQRAMRWWRQRTDPERRVASWIVLCGVLYVIHYVVYCVPQPFFIEDAAISFAYSKHLAQGEGLVTYPGGERVEGYSNALWTFLIAGWYALGVPVWTSAKLMGALFGLATLPFVYDITRRMRPNKRLDVALLAPLALSLSPQFVIWNASGLENSLYGLLLASGSWRLLIENDDEDRSENRPRRWPLSALLFFLMTMTRPEGLMYALIGLFALVLYAIADRRPMRVLAWVLAFAIPFAGYHAWRYWYFAWPFPNTYYAKLGDGNRFRPYSWSARGWKYIKAYLTEHGLVFGLPLLFFALGGTAQVWKRRLSVFLMVLLAVLIFTGGHPPKRPDFIDPAYWPEIPEVWRRVTAEWIRIRVWSIAAISVLMGMVTLAHSGWRARGLMWAHCAAGVFFALYSGGDWMDQWRWFHIVSISLLPLMLVGVGELLDFGLPEDQTFAMPQRLRAWTPFSRISSRAVLLVALMVPFAIKEIQQTVRFLFHPETSVRDIHRRVWYMQGVQKKLDLDHVTLLDVDMGAHMYFSGWDIVDIAGLVDVPIAQHSDYHRKFVEDYIFKERKPDFAHVHGGWARTSRIPRQKEWKRQYIEIPGYPISGRRFHIGNHIRKDLFVERFTKMPEEGVSVFEGGILLMDHAVPAPEVAAGSRLAIHTTWQADGREDGFQIYVFLDDGDGHQAIGAIEPGYGWYLPEEWKVNEKVTTRGWLPLPSDLPEGEYALGLALVDQGTNRILAALDALDAHRYLPGELILPDTVQIVSPDAAMAAAAADWTAALSLAEQMRCEDAWQRFKDAGRHVDGQEEWIEVHDRKMRDQVARCYLAVAAQEEKRPRKIAALKSARRWNHRVDGFDALADPLVESLDREGDAFFAEEKWTDAYRVWKHALALKPSLSWTRRKAEEARDARLDIVRPGRDVSAEERYRRRQKSREEDEDGKKADAKEEGAGGEAEEQARPGRGKAGSGRIKNRTTVAPLRPSIDVEGEPPVLKINPDATPNVGEDDVGEDDVGDDDVGDDDVGDDDVGDDDVDEE